MPVLLGIDLGTTVLKVCALDGRTGAELGSGSRRLPVIELPRGGREQDLRAIDRAFAGAVSEAREQVGRRRWAALAGVGVAAQGGSSIIARRASGVPLTRMILWTDGRTRDRTARFAREVPESEWRRRTLNRVPPDGLGRLAWLKERRPRLFVDENIHIGAGEYLFHRLTGTWRQDAGNAIQIGSYDAARARLDGALLDRIGLPLSFVAPLRRAHETAPLSRRGAELLGAAAGIPVAGPYIDQETGYLSAAAASERPLHVSLGTAWVGNFVLPRGVAGSSPTQFVLPSPAESGRLIIQPLLAGNPTWDWALRTCAGGARGSPFDRAEAIFERALLPAGGLVALPWFSQTRPDGECPYGMGVLAGLSDTTTADDILRAVAAGLAFELLRVFEDVRDASVLDCVVAGGGASKGPYFRALLAALFHPLPVLHELDADRAVARGAVYAFDRRAARAKTSRVEAPPRRERERIRAAFDRYKVAFEALYGAIPAGGAFRVRRRRKP